jgi:hypothetical protein
VCLRLTKKEIGPEPTGKLATPSSNNVPLTMLLVQCTIRSLLRASLAPNSPDFLPPPLLASTCHSRRSPLLALAVPLDPLVRHSSALSLAPRTSTPHPSLLACCHRSPSLVPPRWSVVLPHWSHLLPSIPMDLIRLPAVFYKTRTSRSMSCGAPIKPRTRINSEDPTPSSRMFISFHFIIVC